MATVFERRREDKFLTDETKTLVCTIKDAQNTDGYIKYSIEVWRAPDNDFKWVIQHRYSDFAQLHAALKTAVTNLPMLPPKKVFGNTDRDFINERKSALQKYLDEILSNIYIASSLTVRRFLDPSNYSTNLQEEARQNVCIILRSGGGHEATDALPNLGTRLRKMYFLAHPLSDPKNTQVLWWLPYGPDRSMNIRDLHSTLTALVQCQHPYIVTAVSAMATEHGVCVVRPWYSQGSVHDFLHGCKPRGGCLSKYSGERVAVLPERDIAVYGRQTLLALQYLHEKGYGHGHVHTGNLIIENNACRLLDLENQLVGVPNQYRHFMIHLRKINSIEAIDVYSFGRTLYEMVFTQPLLTGTCDDFPEGCSPMCRSVLESILSSEACKNGLPSIAGLLTHPFFNQVPLVSHEKPSLRLSSALKAAVTASQDALLARLQTDQKKIRQQRKLSKAEAIVSQSSKSRSKKRSTEANGWATSGAQKEVPSTTESSTYDKLCSYLKCLFKLCT